LFAPRREQAEQQENERQAGIARENAQKERAESARAKAAEEAALRAQAETDRMAAERSKAHALEAARQAELQKRDADAARQAAVQAKNEADAARQAAIAQQQQFAAETERARMAAADRLRQNAEQGQAQLRQQLLDQFNAILRTRDNARGLIVNMSDVLFDTGKYTLRPGAREKLAKVAGIIMSHPGLRIEVEGHTDSVGGDEYNMRLSENRATAVQGYLVEQGIQRGNVTAKGFGKSLPVTDNSTAEGRQMNRRVDLVVSGDIIGTSITAVRTSTIQQP
jgi:outer membrane protein OmpA-like peptidoglycan-associated protein